MNVRVDSSCPVLVIFVPSCSLLHAGPCALEGIAFGVDPREGRYESYDGGEGDKACACTMDCISMEALEGGR